MHIQVDVIGKSNHILAVPMLSLTLRWSAKLKGDPLAAPLTVLLADCCQRLHMHFTQFIMDRVGYLPCSQCLMDAIWAAINSSHKAPEESNSHTSAMMLAL